MLILKGLASRLQAIGFVAKLLTPAADCISPRLLENYSDHDTD